MIEIFDRQRRRVAIAENAHGISEQKRINSVWYLYFSLPYKDPKNEYCQPFRYVRHNGGELYRIMPEDLSVDESGSVTYQCEHVLATLIDNILFGYHVVGNLGTYTADVIRYVLDHQLVKNWVLDECDYRNQFEYGWEQESLLSALFSVATPLAGPYIWRTNTAVYPWRLSLKRLDTTGRPEMYVRRRHNMTSYRRGKDPQNIVTRLYPLGYGEGVNQLGIGSVNGGVPYLQSPKAITDKYGIIERVWVDRRYEDPSSLKAAAEAMLQELQEPLVSYEVGYQEMTSSDFDKAEIGKRLRIVYPEIAETVDTFITEIRRDYEDAERSSLVVANKETSIASSLADMADRQRIEQTYAQGATQIYMGSLPPVLRNMAASAAENLQVDPGMTAVAGLAVAALCVQGKYIINPKPGWVEPLNLYASVIARPSERKTPAQAVMTRPLYAFEKEENQRRAPLIDEYLMKRDVLKKKIFNMKEAAAKPTPKTGKAVSFDDITELQYELSDLEREAVKPLRLLADDTAPRLGLPVALPGGLGFLVGFIHALSPPPRGPSRTRYAIPNQVPAYPSAGAYSRSRRWCRLFRSCPRLLPLLRSYRRPLPHQLPLPFIRHHSDVQQGDGLAVDGDGAQHRVFPVVDFHGFHLCRSSS